MSFTDKKEYELRYTTSEDLDFVTSLVKVSEVRKWLPPSSDEDCLLFSKNWVSFGKYKAALTALYEGIPIGAAVLFLMPYKKVAHLAIVYVAVDPKFQRMGVGRSLIRNICHLGKSRFRLESVHFEVYEGCPICSLLESLEFKEIASQKNFVRFPEGLAGRIIYEKDL